LNSWMTVREDAAQAVDDFPAGELDFRPTDEVMTFGQVARHILEAGHAISGIVLEGVDNLAVPNFREMMMKHVAELPATPGAADLSREMRANLAKRKAELAAKPEEFYAHEITRFDGLRISRLELLQNLKEHELTHRQELFMYLRLKGIVPPTTRRRTAKAKA
jgi:uncharacterized damage-inducible protein DinB